MAFTVGQNQMIKHACDKEESSRQFDVQRRQWQRQHQKQWSEENRASIRSYWRTPSAGRNQPAHWGSRASTLGTQAIRAALAESREDFSADSTQASPSSSSGPGKTSPGAWSVAAAPRPRHGNAPALPEPVMAVPEFPKVKMGYVGAPLARLGRSHTAPTSLHPNTDPRKVAAATAAWEASAKGTGPGWVAPIYLTQGGCKYDSSTVKKPNEMVPIVDGSVPFKPVPGVRYGTVDNRLGIGYITAVPMGNTRMWPNGMTHRLFAQAKCEPKRRPE